MPVDAVDYTIDELKSVECTKNMEENDSPTVKQGTLEDDLGRLAENPCKQERQLAEKGSHSLDLKRAVLGVKRSRPEVKDGGESQPKSSVYFAMDREDQCLGLVAEAFVDEIDLLRQDEHFRGSDRDVAAMADMMRCMTGGMDSTEKKLFLESAAT